MVFTVFNKDALDFLKEDDGINTIYTAYANTRPTAPTNPGEVPSYEFLTPDQWEEPIKVLIKQISKGDRKMLTLEIVG